LPRGEVAIASPLARIALPYQSKALPRLGLTRCGRGIRVLLLAGKPVTAYVP